jgi:hypothetical protein
MATVFEECTAEEQRCVVRFRWAKDSIQRIFLKKSFLFSVGIICRVKRFTTVSINSLKDNRNSQMLPDQMRKWLRQQSKYFYATGFDALVKRWGINVGGGYVEK